VRRGSKKTLKVVTGRLDEQQADASDAAAPSKGTGKSGDVEIAGLTLQNINDEKRQKYDLSEQVEGALVVDVDAESDAYESGLRVGDVIVELNQDKVKSAADVVKGVEAARKADKKTVLIFVETGEARRFIALPVGK
jgi:serine protease Do